jgi:secreted trypsin-like serine protease
LQSAKAKIKGFSVTEVRLDESKGQGTCSGDSGGPAFIQKGGNYLLFGVTSRGNLLCNEEGIYTSASAHSAWIEKTMQSLK